MKVRQDTQTAIKRNIPRRQQLLHILLQHHDGQLKPLPLHTPPEKAIGRTSIGSIPDFVPNRTSRAVVEYLVPQGHGKVLAQHEHEVGCIAQSTTDVLIVLATEVLGQLEASNGPLLVGHELQRVDGLQLRQKPGLPGLQQERRAQVCGFRSLGIFFQLLQIRALLCYSLDELTDFAGVAAQCRFLRRQHVFLPLQIGLGGGHLRLEGLDALLGHDARVLVRGAGVHCRCQRRGHFSAQSLDLFLLLSELIR
mmetsp:Transcript_17648/g.67106  ORF Transcript_17648/g.67106 Transcript_17648/m.67106 type:complete len:252 (-) Transcript_17648:795-1550(-)